MGIQGLLSFTKNSCRPANVRDFKGCTVAIDAYGWLHKGAFSCAEKIVKGEKTDGYVHFCMKQLNLLLGAGLKPIMVFDGCNLESKAVTEKKRRENRDKTRQKAKEFLCQGNLKEARECFQRCIDITPEMALEVIQACRAKGIDCIVAPYEADAQLAYLNQANIADIVITEDSDLIVFGCTKILFKMDGCGGGMLYERENLPKSFGNNAERMSFEKFRYVCILSGCDYLPSLHGIGLAKAYKFFTLTVNPDLQYVLSRLPSYLKMPRLEVTEEYKQMFVRANKTFLYQLVFCPKKKVLVPLNPYPSDMECDNMDYAGKYIPQQVAYQLALGNINIKTMERFNNNLPDSQRTPSSNDWCSIWDENSTTQRQLKTESSFKVKPRSPKSPVSTKPKLSPAKEESENIDLSQEDLFSSYATEQKEEKMDVDTDKETRNVVRHCPFRKSLSASSVNIAKDAITSPSQTIVRSRFFWEDQPTDKRSSPNTTKKTSWLDEIDSEYTPSKLCIKSPVTQIVEHSRSDSPKSSIATTDVVKNSFEDKDCGSSDIECTDSPSQVSIEISTQSDSGFESQNDSVASGSMSFDEHYGVKCSPSSSATKRTSSYFSYGSQDLRTGKSLSTKQSGSTLTPITRCRTVGLSKNKRPKLERQLSVKDTLFNFSFTRTCKTPTAPE